jgi:carbon storage regulator
MPGPARTESPHSKEESVLIITRRPGERIMVGDDVVVEVMEIVGNTVRFGVDAPRDVPVYRDEIYAALRAEERTLEEHAAEPTGETGTAS